MTTATTAKTTVVHRFVVHLADNEWGNALMDQMARRIAENYRDCWPLIVRVNEHAGWFLSYLFGAPGIRDGAICGTANDGARLLPEVEAFGASIRDVVELGYERRVA
jgi:hypothetical protein